MKPPVLEEGLSGEALLKEVQKAFRLRGVSLKNAELLEAGGGPSVAPEKGTGVLDPEDFSAVAEFARRKAAQTAEAVRTGRAETAPYRKSKRDTACARCDYASVCGFDPTFGGCTYRSVRTVKADAFLEEARHETVDE